MPSVKRAWVRRYGIAVLTSLLTLLLRFLLEPLLGGEAPLLAFIMPVMVSAWYGGLKPGLLSTALSALVSVYLFVPPFFSVSLVRVTDIVRVCIFLVEGVLISALCEALRSAKQRTEAIALSLHKSEEELRKLVKDLSDVKFALDRAAILAITDAQGIITDLTTLCPKSAEILGSSSPLTKYGFPYLPEVVLSSSFRLIAESCSRVPHGTIQNLKSWFFWYLLLEVFTCTSFPVQNPITVARRRAPASLTVFKVRCLSATGFLKWLNTLSTCNYNTTKAVLEGQGFRPINFGKI